VVRRDVEGNELGPVDLEPLIFGIEPNQAVLHQVVTAQLAAARSGTQSTKTRAEVRGGGAKPYPKAPAGPAGLDPLPQWWAAGGPRAQAPRLPPADAQEDDPPGLRSALSDRRR